VIAQPRPALRPAQRRRLGDSQSIAVLILSVAVTLLAVWDLFLLVAFAQ
jgi:hypothetical protein